MNYIQEVVDSQKGLHVLSRDSKGILTKAKFGPSKHTFIPFHLDESLSFFIAAIIGDGHLKKSKFQIVIELTNLNLLREIQLICKDLFRRDFNINKVKLRSGRKPSFVMLIDSKSIYDFLRLVFEIPPGKKSHIVRVPKFIKFSGTGVKLSFLQGIMATEGGRRRRGYGLSTASEFLWRDLIILFNELDIPLLTDSWLHKRYKKKYYGLSFEGKHINRLTRGCQSGQMGEI